MNSRQPMFSRDSVEDTSRTSYDKEQLPVDMPGHQVNEEESISLDLPDVQKSHMYLVEEDKPEIAYHLLSKSTAQGLPGLCVTRVYPEMIEKKYDFGDCTIMWLSNAGAEESIRPRDLERLSLLIEQFLAEKKGAILVDGIEYLITNNDFLTVLRLIQSLRDHVAMNTAIMIISLNPSTLGCQELSLLEREMDSVLRFHEPENDSKQDFHTR